uniref:SCP domain-containing protein n=1 Tax=Toxocara canis TaxID=6265 RepID=A0A183U2D2_TOXCA
LKQYDASGNPKVVINDDVFKVAGHWSQVAWGATTQVGCGITNCGPDKFIMVTCNYLVAREKGWEQSSSSGYLSSVIPHGVKEWKDEASGGKKAAALCNMLALQKQAQTTPAQPGAQTTQATPGKPGPQTTQPAKPVRQSKTKWHSEMMKSPCLPSTDPVYDSLTYGMSR